MSVRTSFGGAVEEALLLIVAVQHMRREAGETMPAIVPSDLVTPLFRGAVEFLRTHGKSKIEYLSPSGYVEISG